MAAAVALLLLGYVVGLRSPWSAHHTRTVDATLTWLPADVPAAHLEFDDERTVIMLEEVPWNDGRTGDQGSIPPCVRTDGEPVELKAQVIKLSAEPVNSGSYWQVVSLTCPSGGS